MTEDGIAMLKLFEQFRPYKYLDTAGNYTIGWGHLIRSGEFFSEPMSPQDGEALLEADIARHETALLSVEVPLQPYQQDALTSLIFNIGVAAFTSSTLLKLLNAGEAEAVDRFLDWVKAGGRSSWGLTRRRNAEAVRFLGGSLKLVTSIYRNA